MWAVAVSLVLWVVVRHEVDELLDTTLQESAEILAGLLRFRGDLSTGLVVGGLPQTPHEERLAWQLVDMNNQVLIKSYIAPTQALASNHATGFTELTPGWRVFSIRLASEGPTLHVAQSHVERFEARTEAVGFAIIAALFAGVLTAIWMRARVKTELEPLSLMADRISAINLESPMADLPAPTRRELATVRLAIVTLANRLRQRLDSERAFSAHAAHALRTPLAAMVAQLAAAQNIASEDVNVYLSNSRVAAQRLGNVVTALMALFRAGETIKPSNIDLRELLRQLPIEEGLSTKVTGQYRLFADPDLLAAVLLNLFDNSVRHGATRVEIFHEKSGNVDHLVIQDNGVGQLSHAPSQPLAAYSTTPSPGGLGLELARLVAKAHGGETSAAQVEIGFRVELRWPTIQRLHEEVARDQTITGLHP